MRPAARAAKAEIWGESVLPWIYFLRGEPVLEARADLERSQWRTLQEIEELQERKLETLLGYCASHVPFYAERFARAGVAVADLAPREALGRLPILERGEVRELAARVRQTLPRGDGYSVRRTAGTGGEPVIVYADAQANARMLAARLRCQSWLGIRIGDKEARFWGRSLDRRGKAIQRVRDALLNRERFDPEDLRPDVLDETVRRFIRARPDFAYGYSTMILEFADRLGDRAALEAPFLKAAFLSVEATRPAERRRLAELLGCPVADEYGCSEIDIIAHQCEEGYYHVIAENVLLEIVAGDASDPRRGEVLVTDLNNRLTPLVRYRLGDLVIGMQGPCRCGRGLPRLEGFAGRSKHQYMTFRNGRRVHSYYFDFLYDDLMESGIVLKQVQALQLSDKELVLSFVLGHDSSETRAEISRRVAAAIEPVVGPGVVVRERYVERVETPPGRKYEYFIPMNLSE